MDRPSVDDYFGDWKQREALVQEMIPVIGRLFSKRDVGVFIYGRPLHNRSVTFIMKSHRFVRQIERNEMSEFESHPVLMALAKLDIWQAQIDLGKLTVAYMDQLEAKGDAAQNVDDFVRSELADIDGVQRDPNSKSQDVVLYGFGRIGRLMARLLIERTSSGEVMRLKAIVVRPGGEGDLQKRASLFSADSVHGAFQGTLRVDEENNSLIANGNELKVIYANSPEEIDYTKYGINDALIIDNTGMWRDEEGLSRHLKAKGASKVLLTAPGKGNIKNIVYGINDHIMKADDKILTAASCTTNAIAPVLKVINDKFGIDHGHVETVHAYTNDQNLIDNYHKGSRRGRSAALNMVLTETGAAKAVVKAIPELEGKLTGNAIRVPIPNVSMAVMNLSLATETTKEELNEFLRDIALHSNLQDQISLTESEDAVSSDFVGTREAGIVDSHATIVNGNHCVLYLWYDNEFGYCCQVGRMVYKMAGVNYQQYPIEE
ncbi:MAG: glyceraldehyde-3-phosphate dehydrogenase [Gammaproteobacteria bacterium]|nr:glyceraldehyde-3-phosphate dehydrogenase [Gammaproteobacteria bacterium]MBT3858698.1 glyceraldehyde-3-phosphate dehydrogenase [Gammaproteobacteria bacterium]MBT3986050.1 glyceraldehyde-3-phosphate dehydrogenase [Gammaproteobacteria bacterium]MBT4255187.1 glyceraldehyde-3-phosphate dehydrogenase [Gammaproteobacteria bacterium]MBT4580761.1 glyceraldehyde-3-phosphate dehydrogenase [Gammaproteobacteria bacterium]